MEIMSYEWMKQFVVSFAFGGCLAIILLSIYYNTKTFVKWIVKKVRQHREKKLATVQTGEEE